MSRVCTSDVGHGAACRNSTQLNLVSIEPRAGRVAKVRGVKHFWESTLTPGNGHELHP